MNGRDAAVALLWVGMAALAGLRAAEAPVDVDADLLEFLGSVDSDDAGWNDYLEHTDVGKVAKPPNDANGHRSPAEQKEPDPNHVHHQSDQSDPRDQQVDGT